jgi:hypothetical protein
VRVRYGIYSGAVRGIRTLEFRLGRWLDRWLDTQDLGDRYFLRRYHTTIRYDTTFDFDFIVHSSACMLIYSILSFFLFVLDMYVGKCNSSLGWPWVRQPSHSDVGEPLKAWAVRRNAAAGGRVEMPSPSTAHVGSWGPKRPNAVTVMGTSIR